MRRPKNFALTLSDLAPSTYPEELFSYVVGLHDQPHRAYHNIEHVIALAIDFRRAGIAWAQPDEVFMAILFHDAIYRPGRTDNEALSTSMARKTIKEFDFSVDADRVVSLIELTAQHGNLRKEALDHDEAQFVDCDMSILGAPVSVYDKYEAAIAVEYAAVPNERYRAGRRAFLEKLLAGPQIFMSPFFSDLFETQARLNIVRAIDKLRDPKKSSSRLKLEDMPEEVQEVVRANQRSYEARLDHERVKLFNRKNLLPVQNTDPFEVYEAALEALGYLKFRVPSPGEERELIKKLKKALKL